MSQVELVCASCMVTLLVYRGSLWVAVVKVVKFQVGARCSMKLRQGYYSSSYWIVEFVLVR